MPAVPRILLALDSSPAGAYALETAALVAAELQAELQGMFVEDINLVHLAGLPFSFEVSYSSASARRMDLTSIERGLKTQAQRLREQIEATALRMHLVWSFEVVRGQLIAETMAAVHLHDIDILVVGASARVSGRRVPPQVSGALARVQLETVAVWFDGSSASERALNTGAAIARRAHMNLVVLLPPAPAGLESSARKLLPGPALRVLYRVLQSDDAATAARTAHSMHAKLLIRRVDPAQPKGGGLPELLRETDCPIMLVR